MFLPSPGVSVIWFSRTLWPVGVYTHTHTHDFYHIVYRDRGRSLSHVDTVFPAGTVAISSPNMPHGMSQVLEPAGGIEFKCVISDRMLSRALDNLNDRAFVLPPSLVHFLELLLEDMKSKPLSADALNAAVTYFLYRLIELVPSTKKRIRQRRVSSILQYLNENYTSNPSLAEIGRSVGFSPNYVSTLFHNETGITIRDYLARLRLKKACELISYSDISISEVCRRCGFNDIHNFGRAFKRAIGTTPSRYRRASNSEGFSVRTSAIPQLDYSDTLCFSYAPDAQRLVRWPNFESYYCSNVCTE